MHLCSEGAEGDNYYIIESGTFEAYKGDELKFTYEGTGAFGELALMYNSPRQATVKVGLVKRKLGCCILHFAPPKLGT